MKIIKHRKHLNRDQIGKVIGYSRAHITKAIKVPSQYPKVLESLKLHFPDEAKEARDIIMKAYPDREFDPFDVSGSTKTYHTKNGQSKNGKKVSDRNIDDRLTRLEAEHNALIIHNAEKEANGDEQKKETFIARIKQAGLDAQANQAPPKPYPKTSRKKKKNKDEPEPPASPDLSTSDPDEPTR